MKKESFKTLLLAILVCINLYLGKGFWDSTLTKETNTEVHKSYENNNNRKDYELSDVIVPQKVRINFSTNNSTVLYSNAKYNVWQNGRKALESIFNSKSLKIETIDDELYSSLQTTRAVNFRFPEQIYTYMLGKVLNINIPKNVYKQIKTLNSIYFSLGEEQFVIFANADKKVMIKSDVLELSELKEVVAKVEETEYTNFYKLEDVLGSKSDIYIPVETNYTIPIVYTNRNQIGSGMRTNDNVAELFFNKGMEYIKKIEENNGSNIYIDGENVLKIYTDGRLEYMGTIDSYDEPNLYSSMNKAVDFITKHMGWPDDVYLSRVDDIASESKELKGYKFTFRYKLNGLMVLSNRKEVQDKIEVEVTNGSVTSYKSKIWSYTNLYNIKSNDKSILSAFEIIDENFVFLKDQYLKEVNEYDKYKNDIDINDKVKDSITDIYLAYYGNIVKGQEVLKPVWVIEILGKEYVFDAYDGTNLN